MIQKNTLLTVVDNSGAKTASCIHVGKGFKRRYAGLGDIILVSIKSLRNKRRATSKVLKGNICKALVVRCRYKTNHLSRSEEIKLLENSVVLLNLQNKFLFTRIFGPVPNFIRYTKFMKIISMSSGLLQ